MRSSQPLFPLGRCVSTPAVLSALERTAENAHTYLTLHVTGIRGALSEEDHRLNQMAIREGSRVFSSFLLRDGTKIWVITEWDRSVTTVLLPSEY